MRLTRRNLLATIAAAIAGREKIAEAATAAKPAAPPTPPAAPGVYLHTPYSVGFIVPRGFISPNV